MQKLNNTPRYKTREEKIKEFKAMHVRLKKGLYVVKKSKKQVQEKQRDLYVNK